MESQQSVFKGGGTDLARALERYLWFQFGKYIGEEAIIHVFNIQQIIFQTTRRW